MNFLKWKLYVRLFLKNKKSFLDERGLSCASCVARVFTIHSKKKLCFPFIHFSTLCNIAAMCFLLQILIVLNSLTDKLLWSSVVNSDDFIFIFNNLQKAIHGCVTFLILSTEKVSRHYAQYNCQFSMLIFGHLNVGNTASNALRGNTSNFPFSKSMQP